MGTDRLDVEFAFRKGQVYLFQVRPLCVRGDAAELGRQEDCLRRIREYIRAADAPKPFLYGEGTLYSNMTDWNPAEMIGVHPRNLALSLYKELITDDTWAYQRDNYGYLRLRSFPLMVDFCGMPYIDVRVSFNSFVPADLSPAIAEKLVNYYLGELSRHPEEHDKVEFDIIFSCYTFDLPRRAGVLREHSFTAEEVEELIASLRKLTNCIINSRTGLWRGDGEKIRILRKRYREIVESGMDEVGKMYSLIEDCKRYGTWRRGRSSRACAWTRASGTSTTILPSATGATACPRTRSSSWRTTGMCPRTSCLRLLQRTARGRISWRRRFLPWSRRWWECIA